MIFNEKTEKRNCKEFDVGGCHIGFFPSGLTRDFELM